PARAEKLLAGHARKRQEVAKQAIEACIRDGRVDLFVEWHHSWQPENKDDLWPVGPRMARAGQDEYPNWCPPNEVKLFERMLDPAKAGFKVKPASYDGPEAQVPRRGWANTIASFRTDRWWYPPSVEYVTFASVTGHAWLRLGRSQPSRLFALGSVQAEYRGFAGAGGVLWGDGEFYSGEYGT